MTSKKKTPSTSQQSLKIGSRVRCTDDHAEGRIVWANGVSVKIQWDDGEQVTWRRDSLASRPIEILGAADEDDPSAAHTAPAASEATDMGDLAHEEPAPAAEESRTPGQSAAESASPPPEPTEEPIAAGTTGEPAPVSGKPKRQRRAVAAAPKEKKVSALDAAAKVLEETGQPMRCQEMIAQMAAKGYWISPNGRTPSATLYSAVLREIAAKGEDARFVKTERGKFARNGAA
jgi:hypothetical protein